MGDDQITLVEEIFAQGFQEAVVEVLVKKSISLVLTEGVDTLVVCGGVAANGRLRNAVFEGAKEHDIRVVIPEREFCTDNGAMIAYAGCKRLVAGERADLSFAAQPRWPLDTLPAI